MSRADLGGCPRVPSGAVAALTMLVLVTSLLAGCTGSPPVPGDLAGARPALSAVVTQLRPEVLATVPHDRTAFTQGLEVAGDVLLEGTGRRGRSQLRELDPATGAVRRAVDLPATLFGEGITVDGATVWHLTWTDRVALVRDRATLALVRTVPLDREGWGICRGVEHLVTSDGSDTLTVRDRATFTPVASIPVRAGGVAVDGLNELECTPDGIWANVWPTDRIVRIDAATGVVTAVVDATGLLPPEQRPGTDVLNGIAAIPGTDQYWLTGKLWPTTFRVRFVPR